MKRNPEEQQKGSIKPQRSPHCGLGFGLRAWESRAGFRKQGRGQGKGVRLWGLRVWSTSKQVAEPNIKRTATAKMEGKGHMLDLYTQIPI